MNTSVIVGQPCYQAQETHPSFSIQSTDMHHMVQSFQRCVRQLHQLSKTSLLPLESAQAVKSMYLLHGKGLQYGLSRRPWMPRQETTIQKLWNWMQRDPMTNFPDLPENNPIFQPWENLAGLTPQESTKFYHRLLHEKRLHLRQSGR